MTALCATCSHSWHPTMRCGCGCSALGITSSYNPPSNIGVRFEGGDDGSLPLGRWARNALAAIGVAILAAIVWKIASFEMFGKMEEP